jgi:hypothetical protein
MVSRRHRRRPPKTVGLTKVQEQLRYQWRQRQRRAQDRERAGAEAKASAPVGPMPTASVPPERGEAKPGTPREEEL